MKTYNVYWAADLSDYVKITTVQAKQKRSAEKMVRQIEGENIIVDHVLEVPAWSYTMELISMNID